MPSRKSKKEEVRVSFLPEKEEWRLSGLYQKKSTLIIVLVVIIVGILIASGVLRLKTNRLNTFHQTRQQEITSLIAQLREIESKAKATGNIGQLISIAKSKLKEHQAGESMLEILEASVVPEVMLTDLAADAAGTLVFGAQGKDFETVARQLIAWEEHPSIKDVRVTGISTAISDLGNIEGIDFSATLNLDTDALKWQP